ncbi:hypothetical protein FQN49_000399 [Arthroderma sp. PD_2]|nr:hypothetical protein FQN49_000399 [Arthroderma sp. PD_2]
MPHSAFFKHHDSQFRHNDNNSLRVEFGRLANRCGWTKANGRYQSFWRTCLYEEFRYHVFSIIDETESKLRNMQLLCQEFCNETPPSITACEKRLRKVHINLNDWIDAQRRGDEPHLFRTYNALKEYTQESEKIFPKSILKRVPVMKVFMRELA